MIPRIIEDVSCSICGGNKADYSEGYVIFECPECSTSFCLRCFDIDSGCTDQTVLCPNCGQTLELPHDNIKSP